MSTPTTALPTLLTRLATDPAFARALRDDPAAVATAHGITAEDLAVLTATRVEHRVAAPRRLEERLSRSALFFGGEAHAAGDSGDGGHASGGDTGETGDSGGSDADGSDSGHDDTGDGSAGQADDDGGDRSESTAHDEQQGSDDDADDASAVHVTTSEAHQPRHTEPSPGDTPRPAVERSHEPQAADGPTASAATATTTATTTASAPTDHPAPTDPPASSAPTSSGEASSGEASSGVRTATGPGHDPAPSTTHDGVAQHVAPVMAPATTVSAAPVAATPTVAASHYHGGIVREQTVSTAEDGSSVVQRTYADGSTVAVNHSVSDGQDHDTWDEPDGSHVVTAVGDGQGTQVDSDATGDTVTRWDFATLSQTHYGADGTTTDTSWEGAAAAPAANGGLFSTRTTATDGTVTSLTSVQATADGGARAITVDATGGTTTVRLGVEEFTNDDGSLTRVYSFPDGATQAFTFTPAGAPVALEARPTLDPTADPVAPSPEAAGQYHGGIVREETVPTLAAGMTISHVTYGDGTSGLVTHLTDADGNPVVVTTLPDGTVATTSVHDGTGVATSARTDGTSVTATWDFTTFQETARTPDGGTVQLSWLGAPADAAPGTNLYTFDVGDPAGDVVASTTVSTGPDGGVWASTVSADAVTHVRLDVASVANPDGSTTHVYTAPDGATDAFTVDANGAVIAHEAHPATDPGALPVDEPVAAASRYHGGVVSTAPAPTTPGAQSTSLVTHGDGTTTLVDIYLGDDDSVFEVTRTPDGSALITTTHDGWTNTSHVDEAGDSGWSTDAHDGTLQHLTYGEQRTTVDWSGPTAAPTPGQQLFTTQVSTRDDSTVLSTGYVSAAPDGGAVATTIATDGTITVTRLDVTSHADPDGSVTRVYTHPDGATDAFTFGADGAPVAYEGHPATAPGTLPAVDPVPAAGRYHGGVVSSTPTATSEGAQSSTLVVYGDGTGALVDTYVAPDGSVTEVTRAPDGPAVITTTGEGGRNTSSYDEATDSGWSTDAHDGTLQSQRYGKVRTTVDWSGPGTPTPGRTLFTTEVTSREDGSLITTGHVTATAGGGAVAWSVDDDGTATSVPLDVATIGNPDGSVTRVYTHPDGATDAFTVDVHGTPVAYEGHPGAPTVVGTPAAAATAGAAGAAGVVGAPAITASTSTTLSDGSIRTTEHPPEGGWRSTITTPDGRTAVKSVDADGVITKSVTLADGSGQTVSVTPSGSHVVATTAADGRAVTVQTLPDGRETRSYFDPTTRQSVITADQPDGSTTQTSYTPDGTVEVTTPADGSVVTTEATGNDGTTQVRHAFPDGTWDRTTHDAATGHVVEESRTGAGFTTRTDTAPDGGYTYEAVGADGSHTRMSIGADGSGTTDFLQADGARMTHVSNPAGQTITITTTPDGARTVEARTADGVLWQTGADRIDPARPDTPLPPLTPTPEALAATAPRPADDTDPDPGSGEHIGVIRQASSVDPLPMIDPTIPAGTYAADLPLDLGPAGPSVVGFPTTFPTIISTDLDPTAVLPATFDPTSFDPSSLDPADLPDRIPGLLPTESWSTEGSLTWGLEGGIEGSTDAGPVHLEGGMSGTLGVHLEGALGARFGPDGASARASGSASVGATGEMHGQVTAGPAEVGGGASAVAGGRATGAAAAQLGLRGIGASAGGDAFSGAGAEGEVSGGIGDLTSGDLGGGVSVGIGAHLNLDAELTTERIGVGFDVGATLGIGGEWHVDLSVTPDDIVDGLGDTITDPLGAAGDVADWATDTGGDALHTARVVLDGLGDAGETLGDLAGDLPATVASATRVFDEIPHVVSDVGDAIGTGVSIAQDVGTGVIHVVTDGVRAVGTAASGVVDTVEDIWDSVF